MNRQKIYLIFPNVKYIYGDLAQCYDVMIALKLEKITDIQCIVAALKLQYSNFENTELFNIDLIEMSVNVSPKTCYGYASVLS